MVKKGLKKNDDDFFDERLHFFVENGSILSKICPECVDEYNEHSFFKLISISYWIGFFIPIAHRKLREPYDYRIAYVDSMAGSGITSTKRAGDYLCGSCPCAVLRAQEKNCPFDLVIAVEIDKDKADALENRLNSIISSSIVKIIKKDILEVSQEIANELKNRTVSFIVIDPQALKGMTWAAIEPLIKCKGDVMITWFEHEAWRLKRAAESSKEYQASETNKKRLTELFGTELWKNCKSPEELTDLFIQRILKEYNKTAFEKIKIPKSSGGYYLMILFAGKFPNAHKLVNEWKNHVERRINSAHGHDISALLDVKAGRTKSLKDWL